MPGCFDIYRERAIRNLKSITGKTIIDSELKISGKLKDGTVGDVFLIKTESDRFIVKVIRRWQRFGDPESWDREALLYESGFFKKCCKVFKAPECFLIDRISENEIHMWLEYIDGVNGSLIGVEHFPAAAHALGVFHSSFSDIPEFTFLSGRHTPLVYASMWGTRSIDWLRTKSSEKFIDEKMKQSVMNVWTHRDALMEALLNLPRTLCHRDYHYENIFIDGSRNILTAIDWDTAGIGVLGEDIADFTVESFVYKVSDVAQAKEIKELMISNYSKVILQNRRDISESDIRLGYSITVALHWTFRNLYELSKAKDEESRGLRRKIIDFCVGEFKKTGIMKAE